MASYLKKIEINFVASQFWIYASFLGTTFDVAEPENHRSSKKEIPVMISIAHNKS